jgi:RNA polymerase sigma-70 factor (ECF subfamily)
MTDPVPAIGERSSGVQPSSRLPDIGPRTIAGLVEVHYDFIWRSLRRMGLEGADADDAAQEVFVIASRRLDSIAFDKERAFLFAAALRVAALSRRTQKRYQGRLDALVGDPVQGPPSPEELVSRREARAELDAVLDTLDLELRAVFTLYELEELTVPEIAELMDVKEGTIASRLRRAREQFRDAVKRLRARHAFAGGQG